MNPELVPILMIAGLFLLGALGEIIFVRTQIPDVVWLILAGVFLNATGLVDPDALDKVLPVFAALTLIIVLFEGGSKLVVHQLVKTAPKASLLAVTSFLSTTLVVALLILGASAIGVFPDSWNVTILDGIMVGAILGGSTSLIIMPSMQIAKVEDKVANLVGLESAFTDALCVVVTIATIDIIVSGQADAGSAALTLTKSFGIALLIGVAAGWLWMPVLRLLRNNPHGYPVTIAFLMFLYVLVDWANGNAAIGILAFAIIVGNADALLKMVGFSVGDTPLQLDETLRAVHSQISFFIKSFFFTFIGLKLAPPWSMLLFGVVLGIALLGARILPVRLVTRTGFSPQQQKMIMVSLPRGMAAGVLATMPFTKGIPGTKELPSMVFSAVVTSIVIFAVGFKKIRGTQNHAPQDEVASPQAEVATPQAEALNPSPQSSHQEIAAHLPLTHSAEEEALSAPPQQPSETEFKASMPEPSQAPAEQEKPLNQGSDPSPITSPRAKAPQKTLIHDLRAGPMSPIPPPSQPMEGLPKTQGQQEENSSSSSIAEMEES